MKQATLDPKEIRCARLRCDHGAIRVMSGAYFMPVLICAWQNRQFQIVALTHHSLN